MARVLIIAYTVYDHDGRVKRHAKNLVARGDTVDVITLSNGNDGLQQGVNVIGIKMPRYRGASRASYLGSYLRFFARAASLTYKLSAAHPYDLAIACTMPDAAVFSALPARLFGSRIILDIHDTMPELYQDKFGGRRGAMVARLLMAIERLCAAFADRVLAVHHLHRLRLEQAGVPCAKISEVMNLPEASFFEAPSGYASDSGAGNDTNGQDGFVLVCHGTVTRRLGIDVAIRAVALLVSRIPELRLRMIGAGDFLENAKALAASLGLANRVSFEGLVPIEDLPRVLQGAAIGLVPNHDTHATRLMLPVKLLEYVTLGIPVITSRLKTVEYYFPETAVRMVPPGDAEAMADAILELYQDPAYRHQLAQNARRIVNKTSWAAQRKNFFHAVDSLLKPQQGSAGEIEEPSDHRIHDQYRRANEESRSEQF
ncbi:MAG TPA: glycosyltransferase family 4 protein [Candidatus Binataceae bacterium]|nr:glycosyltransferase family 4 protein [Candidatus Binataceae bacterium]